MIHKLLPAVFAICLAACAGEPRPAASTPPRSAIGSFLGAEGDAIVASGPPSAWWRLFEDPVLDAHVERALAANADLRVAMANLDTARASAQEAGAARLPSTVIESGVGPDRADRQPSTSSVPKTSYELGATISWEIDLFGRVRAGLRAARAEVEASAAALDAVRVAVVGDTVAAYLGLCAADAGARLAARQIQVQQRSYELVARQLDTGEVSPLELAQAGLVRERVAAGAAIFVADRRRSLFRLAALQGKFPQEAVGLDAQCDAIPRISVPLPVGDGAALIARRPDIREAEARLEAALARIGVATAELYPRIQLGGSGGLIGGGSDAILTPLITWVFPNQTAVRSRIARARGAAAGALATWDQVLLRALSEVESLLADYSAEKHHHSGLVLAQEQAESAVRRAQSRQRLGAESYLIVVDAERSRNDLASQLLLSEVRLAQLQISLFRALGGGWDGLR